jgi:hypothetical protein
VSGIILPEMGALIDNVRISPSRLAHASTGANLVVVVACPREQALDDLHSHNTNVWLCGARILHQETIVVTEGVVRVLYLFGTNGCGVSLDTCIFPTHIRQPASVEKELIE